MMYADVACLVQMTRDIEKFYGKLVGASRAAVARVTTLGRARIELSNASWMHACRQGQASRDYKRTRPRLGGVGRGLGVAGRRPARMWGATASAPLPRPEPGAERDGAGTGEGGRDGSNAIPIFRFRPTIKLRLTEGESNRHRRYCTSTRTSTRPVQSGTRTVVRVVQHAVLLVVLPVGER